MYTASIPVGLNYTSVESILYRRKRKDYIGAVCTLPDAQIKHLLPHQYEKE